MIKVNGDDRVEVTAAELGAMFGSEYAAGNGIIEILKSQGIAKGAGSRKTASGRGKPSSVWSIPKSFTLTIQPVAQKPKTEEPLENVA